MLSSEEFSHSVRRWRELPTSYKWVSYYCIIIKISSWRAVSMAGDLFKITQIFFLIRVYVPLSDDWHLLFLQSDILLLDDVPSCMQQTVMSNHPGGKQHYNNTVTHAHIIEKGFGMAQSQLLTVSVMALTLSLQTCTYIVKEQQRFKASN